MHLRKRLNCLLAIILITSSFSTGGAQETVNCADLPICKGRVVEPLDHCSVPRDCRDIQQLCGYSIGSGLYYIYPVDEERLQVYCDMETDGGGWLVFQRREDGSVDFYRDWNEYKSGFGNNAGEFWLGNNILHKITQQKHYALQVELQDFDGERRYYAYDGFEIKNEGENFKLILGTFAGNDGDSLSYHNGQPFTTTDTDNDLNSDINCAEKYKGAWWYKGCYRSNLNGLYLSGPTDTRSGIAWYHWRGYTYSMKETEMKIRPNAV